MTAAPPWVLWDRPAVTIRLPQPAIVAVSLPPGAAITVPWPRRQVTQAAPPSPPRVIRLAAPPQGPRRLTFPEGHPLRNMTVVGDERHHGAHGTVARARRTRRG